MNAPIPPRAFEFLPRAGSLLAKSIGPEVFQHMQGSEMITQTIRLDRRLAQGGMGSVWLAYHLTLQTPIAVKFCLGEGPLPPSVAERFRREAALAFRVRSPHVVQIFDHGFTYDGTPYIAMELLEGEDLETRLDRGPLEPTEALRWIEQAARGLRQAHALGVVHRDIKPSNLFMCNTADGAVVKVLDFGIAKNALSGLSTGHKQHTVEGAMLGTPAFMSPEQFVNARAADFRSDLWSLAAVAYQALTGNNPFPGGSLVALQALRGLPFAPPSSLNPALPTVLDAWMLKGLAVDPAARFQSATELAVTLSAALLDSGAAVAGRGRRAHWARRLTQFGSAPVGKRFAWGISVLGVAGGLVALIATTGNFPGSGGRPEATQGAQQGNDPQSPQSGLPLNGETQVLAPLPRSNTLPAPGVAVAASPPLPAPIVSAARPAAAAAGEPLRAADPFVPQKAGLGPEGRPKLKPRRSASKPTRGVNMPDE